LLGPNLGRTGLFEANLVAEGGRRNGVVAIKTKLPEAGLTKRGDWPMREAGNGDRRAARNFTAPRHARYQPAMVFGTTGNATAS